MKQIQDIVEQLSMSGITTSFVFGPIRGGLIWSVDVLTISGETFDKPFAAQTLHQAAVIAITECRLRGWYEA